jgi:DNA-binding response OmpR family regulator
MADHARPPWIALAGRDSVVDSVRGAHPDRLRITSDPAVFTAWLCADRPVLAVLAGPPATAAEMAVAARERHRRSTLRIVHLSPTAAVDARLDALRRGFDAVLPDDLADVELATRLELLDEAARARSHRPLAVADGVILDAVAHEVRRDGALIHLRPKEYLLLAMLAAHPGRAYSRRQLLERVWGPDHDGDPRTVDVHVRWLRSKIEPRPEVPVHLVTVRGVGYRLDPAGR